ncbi:MULTISPECIES: MarR family winged helix-turn-helix transcriptional regulator [Microbacterium]|jgi:DNA-binding MarR family transcriptional regulator|uniref:MarR family transcriptional regulator n=1 Tax=Microbacterium galbinum TaxID=2851646 RepID=A0ABY4IKH9_9MICO|nr:MarR family transcriptional regulator [Microbacterium galbinum]MBQ3358571.1 MarR family transcriptional regulator [Microbacterium sp.]MCK2024258.1 MarR family transcriptional regulator [Microbacterium galbinum]MCK2031056.1 MarR family transcriptional regulator [Microbacterium galbinum]UPL13276.1 MarR family transcriptional regulator [Microbacterium galbinum]
MDTAPGTTPKTGAPVDGTRADAAADGLSHAAIYDVEASDPRSALVDRSGVAPEDLQQIALVMGALGELREAEQKLSRASRRYMQLNETDMRALHYLIVCANRHAIATPGGIAQHLAISTASTTKLLDRLEKGGHIVRSPHPTDRRALAITITEETRHAAMQTVGRQQAKRFYAAARLTREERAVVIRFLEDMTQEIALPDEAWVTEHDE